jgi:hypothetical protein
MSVGLIGAFASNADAYTLRTTTRGQAVRWNTDVVTLVVDPSMSEIDEDAISAVSAALTTWDAVSDAYAPDVIVTFGAADEVGYHPGTPNQNTVRFAPKGSTLAGSALAVTVVTFDESGAIVDADIVVNGGPTRKFARLGEGSEDGDEGGEKGAPGFAKTHYDLQNVLTHEAGHFFGLDENTADPEATMFITSARGETKKRDLSIDDESGLKAIYPTEPDAGGASCSMAVGPRPAGSLAWLAAAVACAAAARSMKWGRRAAGCHGVSIRRKS